MTKRDPLNPFLRYGIEWGHFDEDQLRAAVLDRLASVNPDASIAAMAERYVALTREYVDERLADPQNAQLARVIKEAESLARAVTEASEALERNGIAVADHVERLAQLQRAASKAQKRKKGPARRTTVERIAGCAAVDYHELTGRAPTRSNKRGGFVPFLEKLFRALGLDERAAAYAQEAVARSRVKQ